MTAKKFLKEECDLPPSICRLVSDLLEAGERDQFCSNSAAMTSLEEAHTDLTDMKAYPRRFLHHRTCPKKALEDTYLFQNITGDVNLYGRAKELNILVSAAECVANHVSSPEPAADDQVNVENPGTMMQTDDQLLCEAVFISGHGGSGKTSTAKSLLLSYDTTGWYLLSCKFDKGVAPRKILAKSSNDFFEQFVGVCCANDNTANHPIFEPIISSLDVQGLKLLSELMPVFNTLFPLSMSYAQQSTTSSSSEDNVGSALKRLHSLFHLLLKSIICGGHPVLLILDDLQWSDSFAMDVISDVIQTLTYQTEGIGAEINGLRGGLLLLGSYRDDFVVNEDLLMQIQEMGQMTRSVKVNRLSLGELSSRDINKMLSFKLGQAVRTTRQLSELIFQKTRGHPLTVLGEPTGL